jgi:hypothetical protein
VNKGGFHLNDLTPGVDGALGQVVPNWVKSLVPIPLNTPPDRSGGVSLRGLHARNPDLRVVYRSVYDGARIEDIAADTEATLRRFDSARLPGVETIIEVPRNESEVGQTDPSQLHRYVDATMPTLDRYAQHGFRVAVGCFGVGWPRLQDVAILVPLLQEAAKRGGYLADHEYWLRNKGLTRGQENWSWWGMRYRRVWNLIRQVAPIPILITECGLDGGLEGKTATGWKGYGLSPSSYAMQVTAYLRQLADDPFVHGAMLYCLDALDRQWSSFTYWDAPEVLNALAAPMASRQLWIPSEDAEVPGPADLDGAEPNPPPLTGGIVVPPIPVPVPTALPWHGKVMTVWNLPPNPQTLIDACTRTGMDGVEIKIADGNSSWMNRRNVTGAYVSALKAAGLRVLGWSYNYCDLVRGRADGGDGVPEEECDAALTAVQGLGLDGHTFDLEIECEGHADLVAVMLDRAKKTMPVPIAAHVWADLAGHERYPADVIASYCDAIRPMIYRPVWNAAASWASWDGKMNGKAFLPVWGITDAKATQGAIQDDMTVADMHGIVGEAYWEYGALASRPWLYDFLAQRSIGDTQVVTPPVPPTPPPTTNISDLTERTYGLAHQIRALSGEWRAAGYPQAAEGIDAGANAVERFVSIAGKGEK